MSNLLDISATDLMSKSIVTIEMDDPLRVVKEIFDNTKFHHLLVVEKDMLFGVISDRDLFKALSPNIGKVSESTSDEATLNKKAHQIMTRSPIKLGKDANINDVIKCFEQNNISCIPIIDQENRPVGIISWRDLLNFLKSYLSSL